MVADYLHYVRSLRFDDEPDYESFIEKFRNLLISIGGSESGYFCWQFFDIQRAKPAASSSASSNYTLLSTTQQASTQSTDVRNKPDISFEF